jgi:putative tryptophan/tyrosine transport system ATP-binding protein
MLQVENIHHTFNPGDFNEVHALRGVTLTLAPRQFVTLIGSNGAGKSSLFNAIAGVFIPRRGQILIDGVDITSWPEHRRAAWIGRVFQDPRLGTAASMTIAENLVLALLRGQKLGLRLGVNRERRKIFSAVLAPLGLGLENRLNSPVSTLSGGQRQAITLLMACLANPKILLLDEHTAALDPATARKILDLTGEIIANQHLTTLMITHNMQQALDYGDRTLMMDSGQIVLDLPAAQKNGVSVQDLIEMFTQVKQNRLVDDRMLLT